jgi:type II secretory pathway component PulK
MKQKSRGSVLIGVLWCVVLLAITVVSMLHSARLELRVTKNHVDTQQAYYLAVAGIEKSKALLYDLAKRMREDGKTHSTLLEDNVKEFRDVPLGRGLFRVIRAARADDTARHLVYGLSNEEARLDINHASYEDLLKIDDMTPDVGAAIIDWRDEDANLTPGGAEADDYLALDPPYLPSNAPYTTVRELLRVRGMPLNLFYGEDANGNGLLDAKEDDGMSSTPPDNANGLLEGGWSALLTVNSSVQDVTVRGEPRINLQTATESELKGVSGLDDNVVKAIVAHREDNQFESIGQLLDVRFPQAENNREEQNSAGEENQNREENGAKAIEPELLKRIADQVSAGRGQQRSGVINLNTTSNTVLACLPDVTEELATSIITHRKNRPFANVAELLDVSGMTQDIFKKICNRVAVRGETYRVISEGVLPATGARRPVEAVIRYDGYDIETLYYREEI